MSYLQNFASNLDVDALIMLVIRIAAALICITLHELAHGLAAYSLGDQTAKKQGRLSLNPVRHIDPFGLLMLVVAGVGWAKPVSVDPRYFKNPKRGMALTALAGPVANMVIAVAMLSFASLIFHLKLPLSGNVSMTVYSYLMTFLLRCTVLSVGLGLFNLIPVPPLDGSKVLFSLFPDRIYFTILRYERYIMLVVFALVFFGVLNAPLQFCIRQVLLFLCRLTSFPPVILGY